MQVYRKTLTVAAAIPAIAMMLPGSVAASPARHYAPDFTGLCDLELHPARLQLLQRLVVALHRPNRLGRGTYQYQLEH